jgi:hypothetical protein
MANPKWRVLFEKRILAENGDSLSKAAGLARDRDKTAERPGKTLSPAGLCCTAAK